MSWHDQLVREREIREEAARAEAAAQAEALRQAEAEHLAGAEHRRRERQQREEYLAKRPERWAALPAIQRALHCAAAENPHTVRAALLRVAELLENEQRFPMTSPPSTFEPRQ